MLSAPLLRRVPLLMPALLWAGCSCSDTNFTPLDNFPELENDHGSWLSMDTSPDGRIVVAFYDRSKGGLGFAIGKVLDDGTVGWRYEEVDGYPDADGLNPGDRGTFASMKVAPNGDVWVAYHDVSNGGLRVAQRTAGGWLEPELVDAGAGPAAPCRHVGVPRPRRRGRPRRRPPRVRQGRAARQPLQGWRLDERVGVDRRGLVWLRRRGQPDRARCQRRQLRPTAHPREHRVHRVLRRSLAEPAAARGLPPAPTPTRSSQKTSTSDSGRRCGPTAPISPSPSTMSRTRI